MVFAASIWLLALVPWAGLVLWLLIGRPRRLRVPFLTLWPRDEPVSARRRAVRLPPLAVAFLMASMLLAILAAADPRIPSLPSQSAPPIALIVDRGLTMSATSPSRPRFVQACAILQQEMARKLGGLAPIELIALPAGGPRHTDVAGLLSQVEKLPPTAINTAPMLRAAVQQHRLASDGPVIVVTDQTIDPDGARVVVVGPEGELENVGIVHIAAVERPSPQVMVRVGNHSSRSAAQLRVVSGGQDTTRPIELPPRGQEKDYFVDMPALSQSVACRIVPGDSLTADDAAFLVRHRRWPRIEPGTALAPAVQWMIDVYARQHAPGPDARPVAVVGQAAALPRGQAGIIVEPPPATGPATGPSAVRVTQHPITAIVDWETALRAASLAPGPPADADWLPLVQAGDRVVLAARQGPVRQVWLGLGTGPWERTPDFVVLWKNLLDWLGDAGEEFSYQPTGDLGGGWERQSIGAADPVGQQTDQPGLWPGIYAHPELGRRAVNAPRATIPARVGGDWRSDLDSLAAAYPRGYGVAAWGFLAALAFLALAAIAWRRIPAAPTPPSRSPVAGPPPAAD